MVETGFTVAETPAAMLAVQTLVTSLSLFNFGYNTASISGVLLYIEMSDTVDCRSESVCLTSPFEKGLVVSSCLLGAMVGALLAGSLADRYGRRTTLLCNNVFLTLGPVGMFVAQSALALAMARLFAGVGVGVASALVHVYISEVVPAARRGGFGAILVMMGTGGILAANLVAFALAEEWRYVLGAGAIPSLLQVTVGPFVMPESSRWLQVRELRVAGAQQALVALDGAGSPGSPASPSGEDTGWHALWVATKSGAARGPLLIGFGLQVLQQVSGINVAVYYAPTIFKLAHFQDKLAVFLSAAVSLMQIIAMLLLAGVIDRVGRRPMCFIGMALMIVSLTWLGVSFLLSGMFAGWSALGAVLLYRVAFSLSLGPLPYIITAEIFPHSYRASGVSLCWAMNWISNFIVSLVFLPLTEVTTVPGTFFLFAVICVFGVWFVRRQVPETTGRTLEELEHLERPADASRPACRDPNVCSGGQATRISVVD
mmetsp:Transcript_48393/g.144519  ORF Transcript_48393/g.144519 Transcript_48393/m.144519 type:complete len:485 (-) Transcript_48393:25-1479(-)